jgi:hypothetical protein
MAIQITDQFWVFSMAKQIENCRPIYSIVLKFYFFIKQKKKDKSKSKIKIRTI